jgi:hypothetical protein
MLKPPSQSWLAVQERRKSTIVFLVEWTAIFAIAWMFWSVMFWRAPGSIPPNAAAIAVSALYATIALYGRVLRATGCRRCSSPLPFLRKEVGRHRLPDQEDCIELQYGAEEYGMTLNQTYCRVLRTDMITYQCRHCGQMWEEKVQLPGSGYQLIHRRNK